MTEVRIDLRLPPELKAELAALARKHRQSLNSRILTMLETHPDLKRK